MLAIHQNYGINKYDMTIFLIRKMIGCNLWRYRSLDTHIMLSVVWEIVLLGSPISGIFLCNTYSLRLITQCRQNMSLNCSVINRILFKFKPDVLSFN